MDAIGHDCARGVCLALALACLSPASAADPGAPAAISGWCEKATGFEAARGQAIAKLVGELDSLASWCAKMRLFGCRDVALEAILHFEPDDKALRRKLKYQKRKGEWVRNRSYRIPRNLGREHMADHDVRVAKITRDYISALDGFVGDSEAVADIVWSDVIAIDPDNPVARAARGEALHPGDGRWVLEETVRSLERRSELEDTAKRLLAELPRPEEVQLDPDERALGVRWTAALTTEDVRVLGTCSKRELEACARNAQAAILLFGEACDTGVGIGIPRFTVYVMESGADARKLRATHPRLRGRACAANAACTWLGLFDLVVWPTTPERRLDRIVRQTIGLMLVNHYPGSQSQSWTIEGESHVLATFLRGDRAFQPMFSTNVDAAVIRRPGEIAERWRSIYGHTGIEELLELPAGQLDRDARERAAVLVRYMIESRPEQWDRVLGELGVVESSMGELFEEVLAMKLPRLEQRVLRWLDESPRTEP